MCRSTLQPDLLGERLVARAVANDDELLDIALARGRAPEEAKQAFTVLTRVAGRDPAQEGLLGRALDRHLADHLRLSLEVGSETGSPMPEIIAETVGHKPKGAARQIIMPLLQAISKDTTNLQGLAATIAQTNIDLLGDKAKKKRGTKIQVQLLSGYEEAAERFEAVGDWTRAVDARRHALEQARSLHKAIEKARAAEKIYGELAERQPDTHRADWARSLANLAYGLNDLGRFDEAIEKAKAAEKIYRELTERQPDAYQTDWAWSLTVSAESRLRGDDFASATIVVGQALDQFQQVGADRLRSQEDWVGWAHGVRAEALLGEGNPSDASIEASNAIAILRGVFDQRPSVAAEKLAEATLVKSRCLRKLDRLDEGATALSECLKSLLPLIDRQNARLRRVLRDILGELGEIAPNHLREAPALEIEASLVQGPTTRR